MNLLSDTEIFKIVSNTIGHKLERDKDVVLTLTTQVLSILQKNYREQIKNDFHDVIDSLNACFDYYNNFVVKNYLNLPIIEEDTYEEVRNEYKEALRLKNESERIEN